MYATATTPERARWNVTWVVKGEVVTKQCDGDFALAVAAYTKLIHMGKQGVTLQSANMAFPPSERYADSEPIIKRFRHKGKKEVFEKEVGRKTLLPLRYTETMHGKNVEGKWWCPFCVKFRVFEKVQAYETAGVTVHDVVMMCPQCGVSSNHGSVKKYNPLANRDHGRKTRSDKGLARG